MTSLTLPETDNPVLLLGIIASLELETAKGLEQLLDEQFKAAGEGGRQADVARDRRHSPPGVADDCRRSAIARDTGHGVRHPGRFVSQLRVRRGLERGRLHEDGLHVPRRGCARGHGGRAAVRRARRADACAPGVEDGDYQGAAVRITEVTRT